MNTPVYVCEGTCQAKISAADYEGGLVACGAQECTKKGQPFTKMFECSDCQKVNATDLPHPHTETVTA